jgi:hypothetical protein
VSSRASSSTSPEARFGLGEDRGLLRIEHHLQQSAAVAQVDEDHAAVVAPPIDPAGDGDFRADQCLADLATVMGAHGNRTAGKGPGC